MGCQKLTYRSEAEILAYQRDSENSTSLKAVYNNLKMSEKGRIDCYRYGFQGQEKDDEVKGAGNSVNYTYRMHDPRVGRFFAVDPLASEFPWNSSYCSMDNNPNNLNDKLGLSTNEPDNESMREANDLSKESVSPNPIKRIWLLFAVIELRPKGTLTREQRKHHGLQRPRIKIKWNIGIDIGRKSKYKTVSETLTIENQEHGGKQEEPMTGKVYPKQRLGAAQNKEGATLDDIYQDEDAKPEIKSVHVETIANDQGGITTYRIRFKNGTNIVTGEKMNSKNRGDTWTIGRPETGQMDNNTTVDCKITKQTCDGSCDQCNGYNVVVVVEYKKPTGKKSFWFRFTLDEHYSGRRDS